MAQIGRHITQGLISKLTQPKPKKSTNIGHEILMETSNGLHYIFCVDQDFTVRGMFLDGYRHYFSDHELWKEGSDIGVMLISNEPNQTASFYETPNYFSGLDPTDYSGMKVIAHRKIDINKMNEDKYIAGVDRPIFKPGAFN
tara:strand:+ start:663 stop:1088 length:426 start_codon:yes stop_codon:yes gene_type:complete